jgi:hypothetical protein
LLEVCRNAKTILFIRSIAKKRNRLRLVGVIRRVALITRSFCRDFCKSLSLIYKSSGVFIGMAAAAEALCDNRTDNPSMGLVTVKTGQAFFKM